MSKKQKGVFKGKLLRRDYGYELGRAKAKSTQTGYRGNNYVFSFCPTQFEKITGIKLAEGEEVLVKISIETTPIEVKK
jgi:hypothetical protein